MCVLVLQLLVTSGAEGVVRSELQPEETSGLSRSSDLSRMLPLEAHLLAHGWAARTALAQAGVCLAAASSNGIIQKLLGHVGRAAWATQVPTYLLGFCCRASLTSRQRCSWLQHAQAWPNPPCSCWLARRA